MVIQIPCVNAADNIQAPTENTDDTLSDASDSETTEPEPETPVGWNKIGSDTYYFNNDGSVLTGWKKLANNTFYFDKKGKMKTGWQKINGKQFYFATKGKVGVKGKLATGFTQVGKNTFYFKPNGKNGNKGALQTGWKKVGKYKYFLTTSGKQGVKGKVVKNQITGSKKTGYAYVDSNGRKIETKSIKLSTEFVLAHTSTSQSKEQKLKACFDYIKNNYPYQRIYGLPTTKTLNANYAEYMLKNKKGNCFCYASTFACIARVLGYDARVNEGVITTTAGGPDTHGWTEVKIGKKWYLFDISMHNRLNVNLYKKAKGEYPHTYKYYHRYVLSFSKNQAIWKKG